MRVSDRLIRESSDIWQSYHSHPFVTGMADGSLAIEKFRYYMIQDYLYLFDYARVFALGTAKASDPETMAIFAGYVNQILNGEMQIHRSYMKRLGITKQEAVEMPVSIASRSYTSYMLGVAWAEGPAEIAAAILSCAVSYEEIAQQMVERHPDCGEHEFYGEWIRGYADPGYHEHNEELKALTDMLTEGYTEEKIRHLSEIFRTCSLYELMFWDMGWQCGVQYDAHA